MKAKPTVLVCSGYGLNCEEETKYAFDKAGGHADIVHINDIVARKSMLRSYNILAFPGGFSYGDDTGSGNAFAQKVRHAIWDEMKRFVEGDHLVIGICNGCQILVNLGLVPAMHNQYGNRDVALLANDSARYTVRWTDVAVCNDSPWFFGMSHLSLPIAHGEGKFYMNEAVLQYIQEHHMVALRYEKGAICRQFDLPANPTGTIDNIAAITDQSKRVVGMMPHPERAISLFQLPYWTTLKQQGKKLAGVGPGLQIFQNAIRYFVD